jgi:arabinofuranan 3-O-arabinosyltransferase
MIDAAESVERQGPRAPRLLGIFASRRLLLCSAVLVALYAALMLLRYRGGVWLVGKDGVPLYSDFVPAWVAGVQALHGNVAPLYDPVRFVALQAALVGPRQHIFHLWSYPPTFFFLLAPFGLLRYFDALWCWEAATLIGCLAVVCLIVRRMAAIALVLASPFTAANVYFGQNGFLTAALLGAALYFLERRPVLAGIFIGGLTYKPQWGLLIPVALFAGKEWRALVSAAATTLVLAGASALAFGVSAWTELPRQMAAQTGDVPVEISRFFANPYRGYGYIQTVNGLVRWLHGAAPLAWTLQGVAALAAAVVVSVVWRSPARHALKAATLSAAIFLATPWAFAYDFAALAIPLAFLAADQMRCGLARGEQAILLVLFGAGLAILFFFGGGLPLGPLVASALSALILRRVWRAPANRILRCADGSAVTV